MDRPVPTGYVSPANLFQPPKMFLGERFHSIAGLTVWQV